MRTHIDLTKPVKLSNPEEGEEHFIYEVTNYNKETHRVYITPINSGLTIPNSELVSVADIRNVGMTEQVKTAYKIAKKFSEILKAELTESQLQEVIERNEEQSDCSICHSHDFCDANEVMAEAFKECGIEYDETFKDGSGSFTADEKIMIWSDAWLIAKENKFYTS